MKYIQLRERIKAKGQSCAYKIFLMEFIALCCDILVLVCVLLSYTAHVIKFVSEYSDTCPTENWNWREPKLIHLRKRVNN